MTTRALVHTHPWDFDRARDSLRARVVTARAHLGGQLVCVTPEPLIKADSGGSLWQAIRLSAAAVNEQGGAARVTVRTSAGTEVRHMIEPGPTGIRILVPEVTEATQLTLELPDVAPGEVMPVTVSPQRHWRIHLVHHTHLDIGYTDPQGVVLAEHLSYLDSCLDLTRETQGWPEDARFRWAVEALWSFDQWTKARPASVVDEFLTRIRQGSIELTAMPFNLHTETCSTDELHELMRMARTVGQRYGLGFDTAMQTDVPGAVVGLIEVLAQNGIRYLSVAHNWAGRSVPHLTGGQDLPRLFRWCAPSGASVLVWMTDTPHGLAYMEGPMLGFDQDYAMVDDLLPAYLSSLSTNPYPYDANAIGFACGDVPLHRAPYPWDLLHLRVQGKFGDNAPPRRLIAETVRRWNETWAFPHLRMSRNTDFFQDAEARLSDVIPEVEGDWNDWWADGIGSGARPLKLVRRAQATLSDAQTISTLAALRGADGADEDTRDAPTAYLSASLFNEHTWGAANPWTHGDAGMDSGDEQWHWKYGTALSAHDQAGALLTRAESRLAAVSGTGDDAVASFQVINSCAHPRSDVVRAFLPDSRVPVERPVAVRDARTGDLLRFEQHGQINPNHREAGRFLDIAVPDVPPLGTLRLDLVPGDGPDPVDRRSGSGPAVLEDERLRVEVDLSRAGIASILDQATGRELVNADATFAFNAYIYDEYVSAGGMSHVSGRLESRGDLNLLGSRGLCRPAAVIERGCSPVRQWLTYESVAPGARWVRTTLTLWRSCGRLDVENRVAKAPTGRKESAYFAFPFALNEPTMRVEVSGGVVGSALPEVPGGAAHMRAMRHWVSLADADTAVAWATRDAPLVQFGSIAVPYPPFPASTPSREPATIYSWVHNNLWDTNFPGAQGLETDFAYSIAAAEAGDASAGPVLASRTADALRRPLRAVLAGPARVTGDDAAQVASVRVDDPRVQVVGLTTPEPGQVLVRLQSLAEHPIEARVLTDAVISRAWQASVLGDPIRELTTPEHPIRIGAFGTAAVLLAWRPR